LLNGQTIEGKIQQGGIVRQMLKEKKPADEIIGQIYIRSLSRKPSPEEISGLHAAVAAEKNQERALEDIFWAVLNSREFVFNH
jgi:hypothetical protein